MGEYFEVQQGVEKVETYVLVLRCPFEKEHGGGRDMRER